MEEEKIFIGNIRKCTKYNIVDFNTFQNPIIVDRFQKRNVESILYRKDVILFKVSDGCYVDYSSFNSIGDWFKIKNCIKHKLPLKGIILRDFQVYEGCLFVDPKSLKTIDSFEEVPKKVLNKKLIKNIKYLKKTTF